jgi:hypothetical protein
VLEEVRVDVPPERLTWHPDAVPLAAEKVTAPEPDPPVVTSMREVPCTKIVGLLIVSVA